MPPVLLDKFPEKEPNHSKFVSLFDGQCWKVDPQDYDYNPSEVKAFVSALKSAVGKLKLYIRTFVTIDDHVIVQRRPLDYTPTRGGCVRKKKSDA